MDGTFKFEIEMGNDACNKVEDLIYFFNKAVEKLERGDFEREGKLMDANGNTVGAWSFDGNLTE